MITTEQIKAFSAEHIQCKKVDGSSLTLEDALSNYININLNKLFQFAVSILFRSNFDHRTVYYSVYYTVNYTLYATLYVTLYAVQSIQCILYYNVPSLYNEL